MKKVEWSEQENWVLAQLEKGKEANLLKKFGDGEDNRLLGARFLEALLTDEINDFKIHWRGIRIGNAIISKPLHLVKAEVTHYVALRNCIFREKANFRDSCFIKHFLLNGTKFESEDKEVNFNRMKVIGETTFNKTVFQGPVDFMYVDVSENFIAIEAQFESKWHKVDFSGMKVGQDTFLNDTVFRGPVVFDSMRVAGNFDISPNDSDDPKATFQESVSFNHVYVGGNFEAAHTHFESEIKEANFNRMKVMGDTTFYETVFRGPAKFFGVDISGYFNLEGARFESKDHKVNFSFMKVGQARFQGAVFNGPVDFISMQVEGDFRINPKLKECAEKKQTTFLSQVKFCGALVKHDFIAEEAQFGEKGKDANASFILDRLKVGGIATFQNANFWGSVDFVGGEIESVFVANGARFGEEGKGHEAVFNGLKVGNIASFENAKFYGPVDFIRADIKSQFMMNHAEFYGKDKGEDPEKYPVSFNGMKVGHHALYHHATFHGSVDFRGADIQGQFNATEARFENKANFRGIKVFQRAIFRETVFKEWVILADSSFQQLDLINVTWPEEAARILVDGMTYHDISTKEYYEKTENWAKIIDWIGKTRFNTQNYIELDSYAILGTFSTFKLYITAAAC